MSKKVLKEQHPWANINFIDILSLIDPSGTNKFLPLMTKHLKVELDERNKKYLDDRKYIIQEITSNTGMNPSDFEKYETYTLERINNLMDTFGRDNVSLLNEFNEHLNNKRIDKNDVSQYKSFDEIREVVKIASFKQAQKELRSSTHVVFEDEHWLMIKPLTFESSRKYGSSTKWCTTMENNKNYFYNYSSNGILIYIFNKVDNVKVAAHIRLQEKGRYDNPIKLYNEQDVETDSYVLQLPKQVMETLMEEHRKSITNQNFIKENYPKIYESEWKKRDDEKVNAMVEEVPMPGVAPHEEEMMEQPDPPMMLTEAEGPEVNVTLRTDGVNNNGEMIRFNHEIAQLNQPVLSINGPVSLDDEATESLREQLFQGQNDVDDIIKKLNEYTKTSKLKNLWRKWFGPKVVVVGVPEGTMPYERWTELSEKLNNHTEGNYKFIVIWTYDTKQMTFTTL
jgi:hypothetical protein